ncbi:hypothetical protein FRB99_005902 [Tulasnella sp. 403]|nr:hypothetical protein FRB99_005902 [Tulasnella sp. 403]
MTSFSSFRRRTYGPRCASPPTFVCYELPQPDSYSRSSSPISSDNYSGDDYDSASESHSHSDEEDISSDSSHNAPVERMNMNSAENNPEATQTVDAMDLTVDDASTSPAEGNAQNVPPAVQQEVDPKDIPCPSSGNEDEDETAAEKRRAEKREGKKKEVVTTNDDTNEATPEKESHSEPKRKHRRKSKRSRREDYGPPIRPILTIRSSQGFVWNQDLFVPPYIKERYIASSPPSSFPGRNSPSTKSNLVNNNFFSTSNEADYEVECVEIRVDEGELDGIIPRC